MGCANTTWLVIVKGSSHLFTDPTTRGEVWRRGFAGFLHGFFMVPDHDRYTGAQRWRYPGTTGQHKEEIRMMGWYGNGMGSLGWLGMGVFWLLLLALIGWLVMRLLPGNSGRTTRSTGESALEILDRRLACGELDTAAWQTQRSALQGIQDARK